MTEDTKELTDSSNKKSKSLFKPILVLFVLAILAGGAYLVYDNAQQYLQNLNKPVAKSQAIKTVVKQVPAQQINAVPAPVVAVTPLPPIVAEPAIAAPAPQNNKIFVLYMSARDLRDSVNNPARFKKELVFLRSLSIDYPELQSKVELLEISSNAGIANRESLIADLAKLKEKLRNKNHGSFVANLQSSLGRLVSITKIEGEVDSNDYNSIIKRAEIALEKNDFVKAEVEIIKLGQEAKPIADKIRNINNTNEITEYIVDFAKSKIVSQ